MSFRRALLPLLAAAALLVAPAVVQTSPASAASFPDGSWSVKGSAKCTPSLLRVLFVSTRC